VLKGDQLDSQFVYPIKVLLRVGGDQVKVDRSIAPLTDLLNIIEYSGIIATVDMEIVDAVLIEVLDQALKVSFLAGVYRCGDLHASGLAKVLNWGGSRMGEWGSS